MPLVWPGYYNIVPMFYIVFVGKLNLETKRLPKLWEIKKYFTVRFIVISNKTMKRDFYVMFDIIY